MRSTGTHHHQLHTSHHKHKPNTSRYRYISPPQCSASFPPTPLVDAIINRGQQSHEAPFHVPGHKRGSTVPKPLNPHLTPAFQYDLTELSGLDYLSYPDGPILHAQRLAADAWGADQSWFLVNGTTVGIHAAIMATCLVSNQQQSPSSTTPTTTQTSTLIMARNAHLSGYNAAALAGCHVRYVYPCIAHGIAQHITAESIETAMCEAIDEGLAPKAVLIVSPTYFGIMSDVRMIADVCHKYNTVLIVDEAHGAHLKFLEKKQEKESILSALDAGADIVIQSTHKQLAAFTQSAMLHIQGNRVNAACISQMLFMLQTSSPSYLLMASLDAARAHAQQGDAVDSAHTAACLITQWFHTRTMNNTTSSNDSDDSNQPDIELLTPSLFHNTDNTNYIQKDPWRFTVLLHNMPGVRGWDALTLLEQHKGIVAELATYNSIVFAVGIGTTMDHAYKLIDALEWFVDGSGWKLAAIEPSRNVVEQKHYHYQYNGDVDVVEIEKNVVVYTPAEALRQGTNFAIVPLSDAVGRVCAEFLCPYPPGVPLICPGEVFHEGVVRRLQSVVEAGGKVVGAHDGTLKTVRVLIENK